MVRWPFAIGSLSAKLKLELFAFTLLICGVQTMGRVTLAEGTKKPMIFVTPSYLRSTGGGERIAEVYVVSRTQALIRPWAGNSDLAYLLTRESGEGDHYSVHRISTIEDLLKYPERESFYFTIKVDSGDQAKKQERLFEDLSDSSRNKQSGNDARIQIPVDRLLHDAYRADEFGFKGTGEVDNIAFRTVGFENAALFYEAMKRGPDNSELMAIRAKVHGPADPSAHVPTAKSDFYKELSKVRDKLSARVNEAEKLDMWKTYLTAGLGLNILGILALKTSFPAIVGPGLSPEKVVLASALGALGYLAINVTRGAMRWDSPESHLQSYTNSLKNFAWATGAMWLAGPVALSAYHYCGALLTHMGSNP